MLLCFPCSHSILNCSSIQIINTILIDHLTFKYAAFSKHILTINKSNLCRHNMEFTMFKYAVYRTVTRLFDIYLVSRHQNYFIFVHAVV